MMKQVKQTQKKKRNFINRERNEEDLPREIPIHQTKIWVSNLRKELTVLNIYRRSTRTPLL
jgi:hypothetical protein